VPWVGMSEITKWFSAQLSSARPFEHVDFSACFIDQFAQRDQHVALWPRRSVSQVAKIES
jgi:hypothetical protein